MDTRLEILEHLRDIAGTKLAVTNPLDEDSRLVEDLGLDSVRALSLLIETENRFEIRLQPEDEANLASLGDLITVISEKLELAGTVADSTGGASRGARSQQRAGEDA